MSCFKCPKLGLGFSGLSELASVFLIASEKILEVLDAWENKLNLKYRNS